MGTQHRDRAGPRAQGSSFDAYYFESEVGEYGYSLVKAHIADGIFEESNGAIIFPGEKYGLHTRVLINSLGLPTYEAKELGLNPKKFADWSFDKSIIVTANEVDEYFKVVLKAMSLITPDIASKTKHVSHGVVKFPEGKMSSRTGKILSAEALINEVKTRLSAVVAQNTNIPPEDKENTVEKLAVASIKYTFLKSGIGKDIIFDFDESLSFEGNSAPYLLYMIVRCNSLISKAIESGYYNPNISFENNNEALSNISADDLSLIRSLAKFKESAMVATERLAPHILCTYLHNLAQDFSSYYEKVNILKSEPSARGFRLFLISKVQETLTNGVHLLGFTEVKRM